MQLLSISVFILTIFVTTSCNRQHMDSNNKAVNSLTKFISKPKFDAVPGTIYTGVSDPELKMSLTLLINKAAEDFKNTATYDPSEEKFQNNIATGLARFNKLYLELDTEDREQVCRYFEEMMDCVGLESSNGQLNDWMYNYEPS
jgi:hypothetical protein